MLKLRLEYHEQRAPAVPPIGAPGLQVWRNRRGGVVASGFRHGGQYWMHWPYLATFGFSLDDSFITAFPEVAAPVDLIWDTYRRSVLPMALQAMGLEALHASAVLASSGVIAFCAASETGKSTVAFGLHRRGFSQWSDDGVVFQTDRTSMTTLPLPFEVRLRSGSEEIFGNDVPLATRFRDNGPGDQMHSVPAALTAICVLTRVERTLFDGPARIERVLPAEAFRAVLAHAHTFDPFNGPRREQMLRTYLDLVARVPIFEARFAPAREQVEALLDTLVGGLAIQAPAAQSAVCAP